MPTGSIKASGGPSGREPFGTLVLALAVTVIEVALIVSLMLSAGDATAALSRNLCPSSFPDKGARIDLTRLFRYNEMCGCGGRDTFGAGIAQCR